MKNSDILDAIGEIDDQLVLNARTPLKRRWAMPVAGAAACMILAVGVVGLGVSRPWETSQPQEDAISPAETEIAVSEVTDESWEDIETMQVEAEYTLYYVEDGKVCAEDSPLTAFEPEEAFYVWCEKNGISDVKFISLLIEDNSSDTVHGDGDSQWVEHTVGDRFVCRLTVSKKLEEYFLRPDGELLKDSLERTIDSFVDLDFEQLIYEYQ